MEIEDVDRSLRVIGSRIHAGHNVTVSEEFVECILALSDRIKLLEEQV